MLETQMAGHKRIRVISLFVMLGLLTTALVVWAGTELSKKIISERQAALIAKLRKNVADSPAFLVEQLFDLQLKNIQLFVPRMPKPVCFSRGLFSFDPKTFPESFLNGLVYEVECGSPVYHLKLREVEATREIEVLNVDGKVFYVFKPRADYDPRWLARKIHRWIYDSAYSVVRRTADEEWLDPSHVEMEIALIPDSYVEVYAEEKVASLWDALRAQDAETLNSASRVSVSGGMTMMRMAGSDINIVFSRIGSVGTGMLLRVDYPDTLTNRLEVMVSTNLQDRQWWVVETNLVTAGTNSLQWVDVSATNFAGTPSKFYAIGSSADSDGDGIADGREAIIYHTNPNSLDSDGDGLVDGYNGVVTTNVYPGGVATNGSLYVEGELSWGTDPAKFDTDGDGMGDGWEVAHGHNPLDPNDPPNVSGTVFYSGRQTGTVWVIAVTASNSWSTNCCKTITGLGAYQIPNLAGTSYWIKAWMDSNGNGTNNAVEAWGSFSNSAVLVTNRVTGKNITLSDPDNNTNSMPDWWEVKYFGSTTNSTGSGDPDGDQYTNLEEYQADTDPTNTLSHPWNISGTITYAGPQTGVIHIVACSSGTDWEAAQFTTNAEPGSYTITHLPPNAYYWVKAWRDTNGDGSNTFWEAWGAYANNSVYLGPNATGVDITLADPDSDGDTLPDWWEVRYGFDPLNGGGEATVAWWKLDETGGTNAADATANANNGLVLNASNAWIMGTVSNALLLDGTNDYVEVPDSASLKPSTGVSVALWLKPSRTYTNGTAYFLSKQTPGGATGYSLGYENGALAFTICASGVKTLRFPCALTSDIPVHVAGTFSSSNHRLYVNGAMAAGTNYDWGTGFATLAQGTNTLRLGAASGSTPTNFFSGLLDDVRVCDRDLSSNEVHAVYELGADPDGDGLSNFDEYHYGASPTNSDTDADGLLDGWERDHGSNPSVDESGQTSTRLNYQYDGSGWLRVVTGARSESITLDNEGNVQQLP